MFDVFISYPRAEPNRPRLIKEALENRGLSVFFDVQNLDAGSAFPDTIDKAVKSASVVVGCWSPLAFQRDWVMKECSIALHRGVLIPAAIARLEPMQIRVDFHGMDYADLSDYRGGTSHAGFAKLVSAIDRKLSKISAPARALNQHLANHQHLLEPLGWMKHDWGRELTEAEEAEIRGFYSRAAAAGDARAMFNYAVMLENGYGGGEDKPAAFRLYETAAKAGNAAAMENLGCLLLERGDGAAAKAWWLKAVELGNMSCKYRLERSFPNK